MPNDLLTLMPNDLLTLMPNDILNQLWRIYIEEEPWHKTRLTREQFDLYTQKLIDLGNVVYFYDEDKVIGYFEVWLVSFEQLGRIICGEVFCADGENISSGDIAYLANVWCGKEYRQGVVIEDMKRTFFEKTLNCTHFVGEARRKSCAPLKVFKRKEMMGV
jgi:hypothetical protein